MRDAWNKVRSKDQNEDFVLAKKKVQEVRGFVDKSTKTMDNLRQNWYETRGQILKESPAGAKSKISDKSKKKLESSVKVEKLSIREFIGDGKKLNVYQEFSTWINHFECIIKQYEPNCRFDMLSSKLGVIPQSMVQGSLLNEDYEDCLAQLKAHYGSQLRLSQAVMAELEALNKLRNDDWEGLLHFSQKLKSAHVQLKSANMVAEISSIN